MSGSRREREAQPSSETVHHIVKSEVSALDTKVHALVKAEVSALDTKVGALHDRLSALEAKVESKLDAIIARLR